MSRARAGLGAALVVVAVIAVVTAREVARGRTEVTLADAAADKSDWPLAVAHARAAACALVPGSPWPERGWQRLEAIGHDAEARGDDETALLAYGAMRAAALATRGPFSGADRRKDQADEGLARVAAGVRDVTGPKTTGPTMLAALHQGETPPLGVIVALAAATVAMLGGLARLAWLGDEAARARVAQALAAAGFVTYAVVSMAR